MIDWRALGAACLVIAGTVTVRAEEPACREPKASTDFSFPKGQLGAAATGPLKQVEPPNIHIPIKYRPDVNAKGYEGGTPLITMWDAQRFAPDKSKIDLAGVARLLLDAGADPNIANASGDTALFSASNADVVRMLLAARAKIDVRNKYEATPLIFAGSDEAAVALIEAGADVTAKDQFGDTIDKSATERHWSKTLRILYKE